MGASRWLGFPPTWKFLVGCVLRCVFAGGVGRTWVCPSWNMSCASGTVPRPVLPSTQGGQWNDPPVLYLRKLIEAKEHGQGHAVGKW